MNKEQTVNSIKEQYVAKQRTQLDELIALDKKVKAPAEIFAYSFGTAGSLVLGTGMCLAMEVIGSLMPLGIAIGVVGITMVSLNYFIYKKILKSRKAKYGDKIIALSNAVLND